MSGSPETHIWWASLRHGGFLLDEQRLRAYFPSTPERPLSSWAVEQLRGALTDFAGEPDDTANRTHLLTVLFEHACGLDHTSSGTWNRKPDATWTHRSVTGEAIRPAHVWDGPAGRRLPVFTTSEKRLGVGRGRRAAARVLEWLRARNEPLAVLSNGHQVRILWAGADTHAWCESDSALWLVEGAPGPQLDALRLLLSPVALTPVEDKTGRTLSPLLRGILDSRKGQSELSALLGERVRLAVERLIQSHGSFLNALANPPTPADTYVAACRVVMRLVFSFFAESRELLPRSLPIYHQSYSLAGLLTDLDRAAGSSRGERLAHRFGAWPRLLALFRLIHDGSEHEALPLLAYGGTLFAAGAKESPDGIKRALWVAQGISLKDAVKEKLLHPHVANLATHPHLYGHQEEAIRAIIGGHPTLVSTGTGSGKTECFLFPVISRALHLRDANGAPGISTVIVYPMNALADDQMDRLRELLAGSGITFAIYTGATPNKKSDAPGVRLAPGSSRADYRAELLRQRDEAGEAKRPRVVHPAEEIVSREELRTPGGQPRILLTNVKQLELLLTRQKDIELFDGATLDYLVFDEAHTFRGAFGAETACLIRRLRAFCGRTPEQTVCIGTSATLVDPNNEASSAAGREFAARFFGVDATKVRLVGERYQAEEVWQSTRKLPPPVQDSAAQLQTVLEVVELEQPGQRLHDIYVGLTGENLDAKNWSEQLFASLSGNELLWQVVQQLAKAKNLTALAKGVSESVGRVIAEEEILLWLALGAVARKEERPLVGPVGFLPPNNCPYSHHKFASFQTLTELSN